MKPKPCPFCGNQPSEQHYPTLIVIECRSCGIRMCGKGNFSDSERKVIDEENCVFEIVGEGNLEHEKAIYQKWNTRYSDSRINRLEKCLVGVARGYDVMGNAHAAQYVRMLLDDDENKMPL